MPRTSSIAPGAFVQQRGTRFVVWAPAARSVVLVVEAPRALRVDLERAAEGYFAVFVDAAAEGWLYRYEVDGQGPWPDPCSRYQPHGPHGPSMLVDVASFTWHDGDWPGLTLQGQVIYELHVGAFTPEGTFDAMHQHLPALRDLGVTCIELMPVSEFPGRFNWGYDGVQLFAPFHGYGDAHALRRLVDGAHSLGLGVMMDVVYNHLGPDGNYLGRFSATYFTDRYPNEWGQALNFDGAGAQGVRDFFVENARYWIEDLHLDGLRLDATQSIHDASASHILGEVTDAARAAARGRSVLVTAENEPQDADSLYPRARGGHGFDALWNDDFHHAARVAATGRHDAYLTDYRGTPQELISCIRRGFLYQGQRYEWQKKPRGKPVRQQPAAAFITFLQNHDQVANTFYGQRLHEITSPGRLRALTALLLLGPNTPLLFMGQEFAAGSPFAFFADHVEGLREKVHAGRREFVGQFPEYATANAQAAIPDPAAESTFARARLDWNERDRNRAIWNLHADLLALRRDDPVIAAQDRARIEGAVLGESSFVLRWVGDEPGSDRLLVVNLAAQQDLAAVPEPLLAPPAGEDWQVLWCSDQPRYGGPGARPIYQAGRWSLTAEQATLMQAVNMKSEAHAG